MVARQQMAGVVVSAGRMMKTVKVRLITQKFQPLLKKNFTISQNVLVHDANNSVVQGDVVTLVQERHTRNVHHAVKEIIAPYGKPLEDRPPLSTVEERIQQRRAEQEAKDQRRRERAAEEARLAAEKVEARGKKSSQPVGDAAAGQGLNRAQRKLEYAIKLRKERERVRATGGEFRKEVLIH